DKRQAACPEGLAFFRKTLRQKRNGGGAVSVVDRYDFQGSLPLSGVVLAGEGFFNSAAQYRLTTINLPSR
ncbi:hypothetical protein ACNVD4_07995, partial [Rhizobium sp. BR5]